MGLFSNNKKLCPVCGNPTPRLLATKIQDTPICKECDKKIYLPKGRTDRMTIDDFKQYIQFYEDNQALRDQFEENYSFNFGLFGGDLVLDIFHGLFRVNCDKDSLAFQADNLKSLFHSKNMIYLRNVWINFPLLWNIWRYNRESYGTLGGIISICWRTCCGLSRKMVLTHWANYMV